MDDITPEQIERALAVERAHAGHNDYCANNVRCRESKWHCDEWNKHYDVISELRAARVMAPRRLAG